MNRIQLLLAPLVIVMSVCMIPSKAMSTDDCVGTKLASGSVMLSSQSNYNLWTRYKSELAGKKFSIKIAEQCYEFVATDQNTAALAWQTYGGNSVINLPSGKTDISLFTSDAEVEIDSVILLGQGELCTDYTAIPYDDGVNCSDAPQIVIPTNSIGSIAPPILATIPPDQIQSIEYKIANTTVQKYDGRNELSTNNFKDGSYELETIVTLKDGTVISSTSMLFIGDAGEGNFIEKNSMSILTATLMVAGTMFIILSVRKYKAFHLKYVMYNDKGILVTLGSHRPGMPILGRIKNNIKNFHFPSHPTGHISLYILGILSILLAISSTVWAQNNSGLSARRFVKFEPEEFAVLDNSEIKLLGKSRSLHLKKVPAKPQSNGGGTQNTAGNSGTEGTQNNSNAQSTVLCPKSGIGGEVGCKKQCLPGYVGNFPQCIEQSYSRVSDGLVFNYTNNHTLKGTQANPIVYDGVHFTGEVSLTDAQNVIFKNCKFSKGVRLFGATSNITFQNCIARGNHDYSTDRWLYISPITKYWGGVGKDNARVAKGIVIKEMLVEEYSNDAIENNGGENVILEDFVFRNLWAGGQGVGDVKKCTDNPSSTVFNQISLTSSCAPDSQAFDPHVDGVKVHNGSISIKNGLFENISYQAVIGQRLAERDWRPVTITIDSVKMNNIGFRYTAPLCSRWTDTLRYKVCGTSGGGTGVRANDQLEAPNTYGPAITINNLQQSNLSVGLWISSPGAQWSLTNSTVTWIRLTPRSSEGNGRSPIIFIGNTRTDLRNDGFWQ